MYIAARTEQNIYFFQSYYLTYLQYNIIIKVDISVSFKSPKNNHGAILVG